MGKWNRSGGFVGYVDLSGAWVDAILDYVWMGRDG